MSLDCHIHMDAYFSDDRQFCSCGEELVSMREYEEERCEKCRRAQEEEEE